MLWLLPSPVGWQPNVTQRVSYIHIILTRARIKYVFCSFWNLTLFQIPPCTLPLPHNKILRPQTHFWIADNLNSSIGGGIRTENHRPVTSHWQTLSQKYCVEYTFPCAGFEFTSVVISTDCTGSCKSNYHMITTMTAPAINIVIRYIVCCT
jgi:hypothetical protein